MRERTQDGVHLSGLKAFASGNQAQDLLLSATAANRLAGSELAGRCCTYVIDERLGHIEPSRTEVSNDTALEACRSIGVDAGVSLCRLRQKQQVEVPRVRLIFRWR